MDAPKRNFVLMFTDSVLFTSGMALLSVTAFITYFLASLGANAFDIGLVNSLVTIGALVSQPYFVKKVINTSTKTQSFARIMFVQRGFLLLYILSIPLLSRLNHAANIWIFLACWGIFNFFTGSYGPYYNSLFAKMIHEQQRGRLKGFSGAVGNVLALGAVFIATLVIKHFTFPMNYAVVFFIGVVFLLLDAVDFALMKEPEEAVSHFDMNFLTYIRNIPGFLRENRVYRNIVISFSLILISQIPLAYDSAYAIRDFHAKSIEIALFASITSISNIFGNVMFGILGDRKGHHFVLQASAFFALVAAILPCFTHSITALYISFGLCNMSLCSYNVSASVLIIEKVKRSNLAMSISINTLITYTAYSLMTILGGFLIVHFSYLIIFAISGFAGILAWVFLRWAK